MSERPRDRGGRFTARSFQDEDPYRASAQPHDSKQSAQRQQASALRCPSCHLPLAPSAAGTRAATVRRWAWLVLAVVASVAVIVLGGRVFAVGGQVLEEGASNPLDVLLPALLAAVVAAITGWMRWVMANDLRGPGGHVSRLSRRNLSCPHH
ncbi:hypothetical protein [Kitasatospora sp. NPDC057223]|uniref:hypothetical protein n=1 Tax=Kitasatospora sp. NPDC057223 TaxID=3346055 RepID=UPI0036438534